MEREREDKIYAAAETFFSEGVPAKFEKRSVAPLTAEQIHLRDAITGIPFYVKEALTNVVLGNLTVQQKEVGNGLSAAVESLIARIVKNVVRLSQKTAKVTEAVIGNHACFAPNAALVK